MRCEVYFYASQYHQLISCVYQRECQVGFSNPRGYFLADGRTVLGSGIDWLYTWPVMLTVDAALLKTDKCGMDILDICETFLFNRVLFHHHLHVYFHVLTYWMSFFLEISKLIVIFLLSCQLYMYTCYIYMQPFYDFCPIKYSWWRCSDSGYSTVISRWR